MAIVHFTLPTRDLTRTVAFFESTLGWRRVERPDNIETRAAWLEIVPGQEVHLLEVKGFKASPFEREYGRHIALSYPRARFPELKEQLVRHGAEVIAAMRPTPFERFFFRDPNGYIFEVVDEGRPSET